MRPGSAGEPLEGALLGFLRGELGDPDLGYAELPHRLGGGVQARVVGFRLRTQRADLSGPLALRLFHGEDQDEQARFEGAVQRALHELGYPAASVPFIGSEDDELGGSFLVMEQLAGRPFLDATFAIIGLCVLAGVLGLGFVVLLLIAFYLVVTLRPLLRLHALPVASFLESLEREGISLARVSVAGWLDVLERRSERLGLEGLRPAFDWLRAERPAEPQQCVCHGDYHPGNLMVSRRGLTGVIDWANASVAPRELELSWSLIQPRLVAQLPTGLPLVVRRGLDELMRPLTWIGGLSTRAGYRLFHRLDRPRLRYYSAFNCVRALVLLAEVRERNPWHSRRTMDLLASRFRALSGVEVEIPEHIRDAGP